MFNAQYLPGGTPVYSPWFSRGGDYLIASADLAAQTSGTSLTVTVLTKAKDATGNGAAVSGSLVVNSTTPRASKEFTSLNDLVRYKFDIGATTTDWALFRMLPPTWFDAVK